MRESEKRMTEEHEEHEEHEEQQRNRKVLGKF